MRARLRALSKSYIGSVESDAFKIPARRAEYSLAESALSPSQAEPTRDPVFRGLALALMAAEIASLALSRMTAPVVYFVVNKRRHLDAPVASNSQRSM